MAKRFIKRMTSLLIWSDYLGSIPNLYTEKQPAQGSEWDGDTDNWVKNTGAAGCRGKCYNGSKSSVV